MKIEVKESAETILKCPKLVGEITEGFPVNNHEVKIPIESGFIVLDIPGDAKTIRSEIWEVGIELFYRQLFLATTDVMNELLLLGGKAAAGLAKIDRLLKIEKQQRDKANHFIFESHHSNN